MNESNSAVAIYDTHTEAEAAIKALRESNFQMGQLSIIGKDYRTEEHAIGFYNVGDRMKFWGKNGAFWGGLWGWLVGAGFFLIPGIGHVIVLGPLVGWIAGALEGATLGAGVGVLGAALASAGIPKNSIVKYETAIGAGHFIVTAHGTPAEVDRARTVLAAKGKADVATYARLSPASPGKANSTIFLSDALRKACGITTIESVKDAPKFDFDKSAILPEDRDVLAQVAQCLTSGPLKGRNVKLVGRADPRGTQEYNMALGERRSNAVVKYLAGLGVGTGQLRETSRGALDATGSDETAWRQDRRVDIDILDTTP